MSNLGRAEPEQEGEEETSFDFGWDDDFSRFESDDMKQVEPISGYEPKSELGLRLDKQIQAKEEILYRVFQEHFSPRFIPKMVELFNRLKLVREKDTGLVTSLTFDGEKVITYTGERYATTGDTKSFFEFCKEAQEEFDDCPVGKYREYLEDEEGLEDLPFDTLERLYKYHESLEQEEGPEWGGEVFQPTALSRLEKFKKSIPKGVPIFTAVCLFG